MSADFKYFDLKIIEPTFGSHLTDLIIELDYLRKKLDAFVIDFENSANLTFDISQIARDKNVASLNVENKNKRTASDETDAKNFAVNLMVGYEF